MEGTKVSSAVNIMIKTERMHRHLFDHTVMGIGIHRTQHRILMHIARKEKLGSQKSLADHIGVTPAAITGAIKRLEADGYVRRTQGADNRYREIELTEAGRCIVERTREMFLDMDTSLFDGFTEEELDGYIEYLEKIQSNIRKRMPQCTAGGEVNEKMG